MALLWSTDSTCCDQVEVTWPRSAADGSKCKINGHYTEGYFACFSLHLPSLPSFFLLEQITIGESIGLWAGLAFAHNQALFAEAGDSDREQKQSKCSQHQQAPVSHSSELRHPERTVQSKKKKKSRRPEIAFHQSSFERESWCVCELHFNLLIFHACAHTYVCHTVCGDHRTMCNVQVSLFSVRHVDSWDWTQVFSLDCRRLYPPPHTHTHWAILPPPPSPYLF